MVLRGIAGLEGESECVVGYRPPVGYGYLGGDCYGEFIEPGVELGVNDEDRDEQRQTDRPADVRALQPEPECHGLEVRKEVKEALV